MAKRKTTRTLDDHRVSYNTSLLTVTTHEGGAVDFKRSGKWWRRYHQGRYVYAGSDPLLVWSKYQKALAEAGEAEKAKNGGLTVEELVKEYQSYLSRREETGEISDHHAYTARRLSRRVAEIMPHEVVETLTPSDFTRLTEKMFVRRRGKGALAPRSLKSYIQHLKTLFNYGCEQYELTLKYGKSLDDPSKKAIRKYDYKTGKRKTLTRDECATLIENADPAMKAAILLALNSGSGNSDCLLLKWPDIGEQGWVEKPRAKTGGERRFRLWPGTINALKDTAGRDGRCLPYPLAGPGKTNVLSRNFRRLCDSCNVGQGMRNGFYSLRSTFLNISEQENGDLMAARHIMGWIDSDISAEYRERPNDERLERASMAVWNWLDLPA